MRTLLFILASATTTVSFGQEFKKHISDYVSLTVSRGIDARLVKSDAKDITIEVYGITADDIIVENKGGELIIKVASKALWQEMKDNHWWARIEIPYTNLEALEATTGAKISTEEPIVSKTIDMAVSMGGELELNIKATKIHLSASMGGVAELEGSAESIDISASMGSEIDMHGLVAKYVKAKSSMGSDIRVYATEEFDGRANMGGYVRVSGKPNRFYENTSMGGDISSDK